MPDATPDTAPDPLPTCFDLMLCAIVRDGHSLIDSTAPRSRDGLHLDAMDPEDAALCAPYLTILRDLVAAGYADAVRRETRDLPLLADLVFTPRHLPHHDPMDRAEAYKRLG